MAEPFRNQRLAKVSVGGDRRAGTRRPIRFRHDQGTSVTEGKRNFGLDRWPNSVRLAGKDVEVSIKIGETKLIQLPKPTESIEWRAGDFKPEAIDDIEPFDYVLVQWRDNGRITWTCYASLDLCDLSPLFDRTK